MSLPTGTTEHRAAGALRTAARCAIVIVSDTRTLATDESGPLARRLISEAGHHVTDFALIPNDEANTHRHVTQLLSRDDVDVVILSGGTGLGIKNCPASVNSSA
jgi:molybdopterin adenylyltransferase